MHSTLRLFRALSVESKKTRKMDSKVCEMTIQKGFIYSPEVFGNYTNEFLINAIPIVEEQVGLSTEKLNSTFHKSWNKIKTANIEQLYIEQLVHYFTTYGFERLGIYNEESVYIPNEVLEIPDIDINGIKLVVIKAYTKKELKEKILNLTSGIALSEDTLKDINDVIKIVGGLSESEIFAMKNREMRIRLYDSLDYMPQDPIEFLRYAIFKTTDSSLIIKNRVTKLAIENSSVNSYDLFVKYNKIHGFENLASIFNRYKPIFMSFKVNHKIPVAVNRISKLSKTYHKPLPEDFLNSITGKLKHGEKIDQKILKRELKKVNTFRKVSLAYALNYRLNDPKSIIYKIRNGKGYATDFKFDGNVKPVLATVLESIENDLAKKVKDKTIYIPDIIKYALPATEKQFTGMFPSGTYVTIPSDMIMGVHWQNQNHHRVDLDLSMISVDGGKYGWDGYYRDDEREILFSGDMTDAPGKGATELFYIKKQLSNSFIVFVNYFNFDESVPVPTRIFVASEKAKNFKKNYMVDPNNVVALTETKIKRKQKVLGLLIATKKGTRFYFSESDLGDKITTRNGDISDNARKYFVDYFSKTIELNKILEKAGAKIVNTIEDDVEIDINLSPEDLQKDTLIDLFW